MGLPSPPELTRDVLGTQELTWTDTDTDLCNSPVEGFMGLGPRVLAREGFSVGSESKALEVSAKETRVNNIRAYHLPTKQKC